MRRWRWRRRRFEYTREQYAFHRWPLLWLMTGGAEKIRCIVGEIACRRARACVLTCLWLVTRPRVRVAWRFLVRRSVCLRGGGRAHSVSCVYCVRYTCMRVRVLECVCVCWVQECERVRARRVYGVRVRQRRDDDTPPVALLRSCVGTFMNIYTVTGTFAFSNANKR